MLHTGQPTTQAPSTHVVKGFEALKGLIRLKAQTLDPQPRHTAPTWSKETTHMWSFPEHAAVKQGGREGVLRGLGVGGTCHRGADPAGAGKLH